MGQVRFIINLRGNPSNLLSPEEENFQTSTRSTWISVGGGGDMIALRHGQEFVLSGTQAQRFRRILEVNDIKAVEIITESSTTNPSPINCKNYADYNMPIPPECF